MGSRHIIIYYHGDFPFVSNHGEDSWATTVQAVHKMTTKIRICFPRFL